MYNKNVPSRQQSSVSDTYIFHYAVFQNSGVIWMNVSLFPVL